jgi:phage replication-related protein YjqB (UPF0714/DUF867 family)
VNRHPHPEHRDSPITVYAVRCYFGLVAEPRNYAEILKNGYVNGRDFRVAFGDSKIEVCLLIAPHGGGIEPGSSEIMRTVAEAGGWAWYEFAGFLRKGNKDILHMASTDFDEPTLKSMLPQAGFVIAFHGASESAEPIVYVGGKWELGRRTVMASMNGSFSEHGIRSVDAIDGASAEHLRGLDDLNIVNLGKRAEGIQLEFSRGARDLLFPPDSSREARGRRSAKLRPLAASIHAAIKQLAG